MAQVTLPAQYTRPEKLSWVLHGATLADWHHIPSKSLRKFLSQCETLCTQNGISWEVVELTPELYDQWLAFYQKKMLEKNFTLFANEETFAQKRAEGKQLHGLFFWQNGVMVAGGVMISTQEQISLAYKASEELVLSHEANSNLGSVVEALYQRHAMALGKRIVSGSSRNQFGVNNSLGYLSFKLRFGYTPEPIQSEALEQSVETNNEGWVVCFVYESQVLVPICITTGQGKPSDSLWAELTARLPQLEILAL